jgi:hypothetical protein
MTRERVYPSPAGQREPEDGPMCRRRRVPAARDHFFHPLAQRVHGHHGRDGRVLGVISACLRGRRPGVHLARGPCARGASHQAMAGAGPRPALPRSGGRDPPASGRLCQGAPAPPASGTGRCTRLVAMGHGGAPVDRDRARPPPGSELGGRGDLSEGIVA